MTFTPPGSEKHGNQQEESEQADSHVLYISRFTRQLSIAAETPLALRRDRHPAAHRSQSSPILFHLRKAYSYPNSPARTTRSLSPLLNSERCTVASHASMNSARSLASVTKRGVDIFSVSLPFGLSQTLETGHRSLCRFAHL